MRLRRYVFTFASPLGTVGFYFCVALGDGRLLLLLIHRCLWDTFDLFGSAVHSLLVPSIRCNLGTAHLLADFAYVLHGVFTCMLSSSGTRRSFSFGVV